MGAAIAHPANLNCSITPAPYLPAGRWIKNR
jgi:hypothetical protein